jgi:hypothetical protein
MTPNFMNILNVAVNSEVCRVMLALLMVGNYKLKGWLVSRRTILQKVSRESVFKSH